MHNPESGHVRAAATDEKQIDALCIALHSRKAELHERAAWSRATARGDSAVNFLHAMLNAQQFIFIE